MSFNMVGVAPHLLIDGDIFAYRAACSCEKSLTFDNITYHKTADLEDAKHHLFDMISTFKKNFRTSELTLVFSDADNFRKKIYPAYKSNRKDKERPLILNELKIAAESEYPIMKRPSLEADDVLGILATSTVIIKNPRKIIISTDKDMNTIPCEWYNPDLDRLRLCDYECANFRHMMQTLTGDNCDGYGGCPGIGEKRAGIMLAEAIGDYRQMWQIVLKAYKKAGLSEREALIQARCARILRNYDYDYKNKTPILWEIGSEKRYKADNK